jgi:hypothetical protein
MGRKSKPGGKADEQTPFCYYCDREFKDEAVLIDHQKAIHFKCRTCGKRMTTVEALRVHLSNVRVGGAPPSLSPSPSCLPASLPPLPHAPPPSPFPFPSPRRTRRR